MSITYEWEVTSMKVINTDSLNNVVIQTYWKKTGTDEDGNEGVFIGATPLSSSVDSENFVPFEQLTQEIVIDWIKDALNDVDQEHVDQQILKQINEKKNPMTELPLPWAEEPTANI
jgi:hypothetical protein